MPSLPISMLMLILMLTIPSNSNNNSTKKMNKASFRKKMMTSLWLLFVRYWKHKYKSGCLWESIYLFRLKIFNETMVSGPFYVGEFWIAVSLSCCLPSDLEGAVRQSGEASASFVSSGGTRAIVELLIPQLQFLDDEGAQAELWNLTKVFLDTLIEETGSQRVRAIFPDAGAAALLKYRWKDAAFGFSSLTDRKPVEAEDEIVVMLVPDYQMLESVQRIATLLADDPPRPLIMWNPRLISEDVGVGVNVRKLRRYFLRTFSVVYSMRPMASGAVFRCYPGLWKVFYDDKDRPGRYKLAKELISRPDADDLEFIFGDVQEKLDEQPSLFAKAAGVFSSINRFMKAL